MRNQTKQNTKIRGLSTGQPGIKDQGLSPHRAFSANRPSTSQSILENSCQFVSERRTPYCVCSCDAAPQMCRRRHRGRDRPPRGVDIPVGGFTELSSSVFLRPRHPSSAIDHRQLDQSLPTQPNRAQSGQIQPDPGKSRSAPGRAMLGAPIGLRSIGSLPRLRHRCLVAAVQSDFDSRSFAFIRG